MRKLTAFVLMASIWACEQSTPPDHDYPAPYASEVPFEVSPISAGDSVLVDVEPLFWGGSPLRFAAISSDTTVVRAGMLAREYARLKILGIAPGAAEISLTATDAFGYTDPPYGHGGRSVTRTTIVEVFEPGG